MRKEYPVVSSKVPPNFLFLPLFLEGPFHHGELGGAEPAREHVHPGELGAHDQPSAPGV